MPEALHRRVFLGEILDYRPGSVRRRVVDKHQFVAEPCLPHGSVDCDLKGWKAVFATIDRDHDGNIGQHAVSKQPSRRASLPHAYRDFHHHLAGCRAPLSIAACWRLEFILLIQRSLRSNLCLTLRRLAKSDYA